MIKGNQTGNPRSYVVKVGEKEYVSNRRDILQVPGIVIQADHPPSTVNPAILQSNAEIITESEVPEPESTKPEAILDENPRPKRDSL